MAPYESDSLVDLSLLEGLRFACRPDCGLCCYAEPRTEADERAALAAHGGSPALRHVGRATFLAAWGNGGACRLLQGHRCSRHPWRPHPCREFPLTAHLGFRVQVTAVLSCPGVELSDPAHPRTGEHSASGPQGLEAELSALLARAGAPAERRLAASRRRGETVRRRLAAEGRWEDDHDVREALVRDLPYPGPEDFPVEPPPHAHDGLEKLPLFWDGRAGPVALAGTPQGWQALELRSRGGADTLGIFAEVDRPPEVETRGQERLRAYLRYWLARDGFLAAVQLAVLEESEGTVRDRARDELRALGADVLARASVRARLRGGTGARLDDGAVVDGIRAVDQDWLDRPTWGDRL